VQVARVSPLEDFANACGRRCDPRAYSLSSELDVISGISVFLLIGVVKTNAIIMIDFALLVERLENGSPRDVIFEACILRFRPILMTTFAALFGALPLALGQGTGLELR